MQDRFKFRYFNKLCNKMVEPKNWQNVDAIFECLKQQVCFDENIAPYQTIEMNGYLLRKNALGILTVAISNSNAKNKNAISTKRHLMKLSDIEFVK